MHVGKVIEETRNFLEWEVELQVWPTGSVVVVWRSRI